MNIPTYVVFSLLAMVCYGICGPLQQLTMVNGSSAAGTQLCYGLGIALFAIFGFGKSFFASPVGLGYGIAMGICGGIAFVFACKAIAEMGTRSIAVPAITIGMYPVVTVFIQYLFQNKPVLWGNYSIAVALCIGAIYFAVKSQPEAPKTSPEILAHAAF